MKIPKSDRLAMLAAFCEGDDPVVVEDGTALGKTVTALYSRPGQSVDLIGQGIASTAPTLLVDEDEEWIAPGVEIAAAGRTFYVAEVEPDGAGFALLILSEEPI